MEAEEAEEAEDTLSISFVDGISCGLAAALLLFIIFGINISAANSDLSEAVGEGSISKVGVDLRKDEPTDIVIRVRGASLQNSGEWPTAADGTRDHSVVDNVNHVTTFIRELPKGLRGGSSSINPDNLLRFSLNWTTLPSGFIDIFRSGIDFQYRFKCEQASQRYEVIWHFDLKSGEIRGGDCTVNRL